MMRQINLIAIVCLSSISTILADTEQWFTFQIKENHIYIPIEVEGKKIEAIFDTGATVSVLNWNMMKSLGVFPSRHKQLISGVDGREEMRLSHLVDVAIPGVLERKMRFVLSREDNTFPPIIGMNFFDVEAVQIDYVNSRMRVLASKNLNLNEAMAVPIRQVGRSFYVKGNIDGAEVFILIDTGNASKLFFTRSLVQDASWYKEIDTFPVKQSKAGLYEKMVTYRKGVSQQFQIGPHILKDLEFFIYEDADVRTDQHAVLGYEILKDFLVTLDIKGRKLYLQDIAAAEDKNEVHASQKH